MSEAKHTPKPWTFEESALNDFDDTLPVWAENHVVVAAVWPMQAELARESQESIANAHLIAAAPELLEALEFVLECEMSDWKAQEEFGGYVLDGDVRDKARAAIAKAKGASTP